MFNAAYINAIYKLPNSSLQKLICIADRVTFKKNELIFEENKSAQYLYIIQKGIARAYKMHNDNEVTFWFGIEGDAIISIKNYVEGTTSYETIAAMEDMVAYRILTSDLKKLYESDVHIANWGRSYAEKEMLKNEERLISKLFKSATERYLELLVTQPEIIKRIPLGYIASYLGITQVSLSRIRADLR